MGGLVLGFYLADALRPAAAAVASELGAHLGVDVTFDPDAPDPDRLRAIERGEPGVTWMCGLETVRLRDAGMPLEIVAAPVFAGQRGPVYHSVVVVPTAHPARTLADLDGCVLAINEPRSWSGHHALRALLAANGLERLRFRDVLRTGSHTDSLDALIAGRADVASIDHTVWADRLARDPALRALRVLARTPDWPAPPFSIGGSLDHGLADAVRAALPELVPPALERIVPASDADYDPLRTGYATSIALRW